MLMVNIPYLTNAKTGNPSSFTINRLAYINYNELVTKMPEAKQMDTELRNLERDLRKEMEVLVQNFKIKYEELQKGYNTMSEAIKQEKTKELEGLQKELQRKESEGEEKLNKKRDELAKPIKNKISKAIQKVQEKHSLDLVLNATVGDIPLVLTEIPKYDILNEVLEELGVPSTVPNNRQNTKPENKKVTKKN